MSLQWIESTKLSWKRNAGIHQDILGTGIVVTADTGYSNETNDVYVKAHHVNVYIPDESISSTRFKNVDLLDEPSIQVASTF